MIIERTPLNMTEVQDILEKIPESEKKLSASNFIEKFIKIKKSSAEKIKTELKNLDSSKIKNEHVVKIIDILPSDASDINKIFTDISLSEDEINKILEIVKNNQ
jgi:DNA-directed RNA polymerase subunit F